MSNFDRAKAHGPGLRLQAAGFLMMLLAMASAGSVLAQRIETFAGTGSSGASGNGGPAIDADIGHPTDVALDGRGNIYVTSTSRVRRIDSAGVIHAFAGDGGFGFSGDGGPALTASYRYIDAIAIDSQGNVFIADRDNHRVRRIGADGVITTVAGNGTAAFTDVPGPGAERSLDMPDGLAFDADDNLYITDRTSVRRLRRSDGMMHTIAGQAGVGLGGDGGLATAALLYDPSGIVVEPNGDLLVGDTVNWRVRRISGGVITTVAHVTSPNRLARDSDGNLYFGMRGRNQIGRISPAGVVDMYAGTGTAGYSGDHGDAISATLYSPGGMAVDANDQLLIADTFNHRIRRVGDAVAPHTTPWVARSDRYVIRTNTYVDLHVVANDAVAAADLAGATITRLTPPRYGQSGLNNAGTPDTIADDVFNYHYPDDLMADDQFSYRICDRLNRCSDATVYLVVRPLPDQDIEAASDAGHHEAALQNLTLQKPLIEATPLVAPNAHGVTLAVDATPESPWDLPAGEVSTLLVEVPAAAGTPASWRAYADLYSQDQLDADLYLGIDLNGDGRASQDEVRCVSAMSALEEQCELPLEHDGVQALRYWAMVHNRAALPNRVRMDAYTVPMRAGNGTLVATGPGSAHITQFRNPLSILWTDLTMAPGSTRAGFIRFAATEGGNVGTIPVRISRTGSVEAPISLVPGVAKAFVLQPEQSRERMFVDVPAGATSLQVAIASDEPVDLYLSTADRAADWSISPAPARALAAVTRLQVRGNDNVSLSGATLTPGRWYVTTANRAGGNPATVSLTATINGQAPIVRSGSYFNAARSGHGIFLYPAGNELAGLWYTYLPDGTSTWYYLQGAKPGSNGVWSSPVYRSAWDGSANKLTVIGQAVVTPTGPDAFSFSYSVDGATASERMANLGRGCPVLSRMPQDLSSHWFNPARAGTGYSVQMWPNYEYYAAFVYDGNGYSRFLTAESGTFGGPQANLVLEQLTGFCPGCERTGAPARMGIGTFSRTISGGTISRVVMDGIYTGGVRGSWQVDETVQTLGGPGTTQGCLP